MRRAAKPARAPRPTGRAVWNAPPAEELEVAAPAAELAAPLAELRAELTDAEALAKPDEREALNDERELSAEVAAAVPLEKPVLVALEKMVVEPTVEVTTEPAASVKVVKRASVVMADAPPAAPPAAPKMVVDPTVEVITEPAASVKVVKMAEVVIAEESSPPSVTVAVDDGLVTKVVSVVVVAPPAPEEAVPEAPPALAQYARPKEMAVAASAALQTALEQSRIPYPKSLFSQRQVTSVGPHPRVEARPSMLVMQS
jgi:hypothetical protein